MAIPADHNAEHRETTPLHLAHQRGIQSVLRHRIHDAESLAQSAFNSIENRYKRYSHHIHNHSSEEDSGSLIEKPMQDLPQNAQEAQG
jgi:hypothetical protein